MKTFLLLSILFLCSTFQAQSLEGDWSWTSDDGVNKFDLQLVEDNEGIIRGNHCGIFLNGTKIDCRPEEDGNFSLTLMKIAENTYAGTIESAYSLSEGKIRLVYNKRLDNLTFTLNSEPAGEYYIPPIAFMERMN